MTDPAPTTDPAVEPKEQPQEELVPQSEVNRIVKERLAQQAKNQFGDYADLKAKAEGAKTLEQQVADLTAMHAASQALALRSDVAARHGISVEDRDLFLTGTDEATLTAQATRLAERAADQKKQGPFAPNEGKGTPAAGNEKTAFVGDLFARGD